MKTKFLFIVIAALYSICMSAQNTHHLDYERYENYGSGVFISSKKQAEAVTNHAENGKMVQELVILDMKGLTTDVIQIMNEVFASLSDADVRLLKKLNCRITISWDGKCTDYSYQAGGLDVDTLLHLDELLFEFGQRLQSLDYTKYKLLYSDREDKTNNMARCVFAFHGLKR